MSNKRNVKASTVIDSEPESDYYETESETETVDVEPVIEEVVLKPKPKRKMTEKQKENLAKARVKAREVLKAKKEMSDKRKELKKEDLLMKKLELQKTIHQHEERKKRLLIEGGLIEPKRKTRVKKEVVEESEPEEDPEIKELEEKLAKMKASENKIVERRKVKKPVPDSSSELDEPVEPVVRTKPKRPEINKVKDVIDDTERMKVNKTNYSYGKDTEIQKSIQSLFPNYKY